MPKTRHRTAHVPAPVGGLNKVDSAGAMPEGDAALLYNLIPREYGVGSRLGYQEWVTHMTGVTDNTVKSIVPFKGSKADGSTDKLFATTDKGLWDCSSSSSSPSAPAGAAAFGTNTMDAGWGNSVVAVDAGGGHNLLYTDEANGYFVWSENSSAWTAVTMGGGGSQVSGVDPTTFVQCCLYAHRAWFVQKNSTAAWYLGTFGAPAIYGAATKFDFGPLFAHGGDLRGLYVWTVGGGPSAANLLVAISGGGDVIVYQGTDPSQAASWGLVGQWFIGGVPAGRRVALEYGGDVLLLSTTGVIPISRLAIGNPAVDRSQYATAKISNLFNSLMIGSSGIRGWSLRLHPQDNSLIVTVPTTAGAATTQLAMALVNRGWAQYRSLPMYSNEVWNQQMYFGTTDGRVCQHTGYVDGVLLSNPNAYTPIDCSGLVAFSNNQDPNLKRVHEVRMKMNTQGAQPNSTLAARYNFDFTEAAQPSVSSLTNATTWDGGVWDTAVWGGDYVETTLIQGGAGIGVDVGIAFRFQAVSRTLVNGFDYVYEPGGFQ